MKSKIGKYFTLQEFTNSVTAKKLGIDNNIKDDISDLRIKTLVINLLTPIRERFGRIVITSGYRCPELNKAVGGVSNSHHCLGSASDCVFLDTDTSVVWDYLVKNPDKLEWTQAIYYRDKDFIHLSYLNNDLKNQMIVK